MAKLTGRKRAFPLGMGDSKSNAADRLKEWKEGLQDVLSHIAETGGLGEGVVGSGDPVESDVEDVDEDDGEVIFDEQKIAERKSKLQKRSDGLNDLEDIGGTLNKTESSPEAIDRSELLEVDFTTYSRKTKPAASTGTKEMVPKNSPTYAALTKQGYSIVGSHSGVKICRWTKIRPSRPRLLLQIFILWHCFASMHGNARPPYPAPTNVSSAGATEPILWAQPGVGSLILQI